MHVNPAFRQLETRLDGNAVNVSKQAAAYAVRARTPYVALFDWDHLFLYKFSELDLDQGLLDNLRRERGLKTTYN